MAYVCTAERLGMKKGMKKMALFLIKKGFNEDEITKETGLDSAQVKALKEDVDTDCPEPQYT